LQHANPAARENRAAYESAVAEAERGLERAGIGAAEARAIRKQLASVETDLRKIKRAAGVAVFHDRIDLRAYALPFEPARRVRVASFFALRPLLAVTHRNHRYRCLAISTRRLALFDGDGFGLAPAPAPWLPESLEALLGSELSEKELRVSASQAGTGAPRYYSHDSGRGERKLDLERFHLRLARILESELSERSIPLVLAATESHQSGLRHAARLPSLLERGIVGNPDHLLPDELHAAAWTLIERATREADERAARDFERGVGFHKSLARVDDVAAAAAAGRVRRLWVSVDEAVPGTIDPASGAVLGGHPDEDVLDAIVTVALRHRSEVIAGAPVPSGTPIAAKLR
jgi:hypothetical protein